MRTNRLHFFVVHNYNERSNKELGREVSNTARHKTAHSETISPLPRCQTMLSSAIKDCTHLRAGEGAKRAHSFAIRDEVGGFTVQTSEGVQDKRSKACTTVASPSGIFVGFVVSTRDKTGHERPLIWSRKVISR